MAYGGKRSWVCLFVGVAAMHVFVVGKLALVAESLDVASDAEDSSVDVLKHNEMPAELSEGKKADTWLSTFSFGFPPTKAEISELAAQTSTLLSELPDPEDEDPSWLKPVLDIIRNRIKATNLCVRAVGAASVSDKRRSSFWAICLILWNNPVFSDQAAYISWSVTTVDKKKEEGCPFFPQTQDIYNFIDSLNMHPTEDDKMMVIERLQSFYQFAGDFSAANPSEGVAKIEEVRKKAKNLRRLRYEEKDPMSHLKKLLDTENVEAFVREKQDYIRRAVKLLQLDDETAFVFHSLEGALKDKLQLIGKEIQNESNRYSSLQLHHMWLQYEGLKTNRSIDRLVAQGLFALSPQSSEDLQPILENRKRRTSRCACDSVRNRLTDILKMNTDDLGNARRKMDNERETNAIIARVDALANRGHYFAKAALSIFSSSRVAEVFPLLKMKRDDFYEANVFTLQTSLEKLHTEEGNLANKVFENMVLLAEKLEGVADDEGELRKAWEAWTGAVITYAFRHGFVPDSDLGMKIVSWKLHELAETSSDYQDFQTIAETVVEGALAVRKNEFPCDGETTYEGEMMLFWFRRQFEQFCDRFVKTEASDTQRPQVLKLRRDACM